MKTTHYLLVVQGDVEPELSGPFPSAVHRDMRAVTLRELSDSAGIYKLTIDKNGKPAVSAYIAGELEAR